MEPETDVVFAAAVAQTLVIEAQADADIRRERATADLREAERQAEHDRMMELEGAEPELDPSTVLDDLMGTVEEAIPEPDLAPRPGHWFYRPLGRQR